MRISQRRFISAAGALLATATFGGAGMALAGATPTPVPPPPPPASAQQCDPVDAPKAGDAADPPGTPDGDQYDGEHGGPEVPDTPCG
jgi:hypothetical protein